MQTHFFPQEVFPKLLLMVLHIVEILFSKKEPVEPDPFQPSGSELFQQDGSPCLKSSFLQDLTANSSFSRAVCSWASNLSTANNGIHKEMKDNLK